MSTGKRPGADEKNTKIHIRVVYDGGQRHDYLDIYITSCSVLTTAYSRSLKATSIFRHPSAQHINPRVVLYLQYMALCLSPVRFPSQINQPYAVEKMLCVG